jgi:O-antigen ligase
VNFVYLLFLTLAWVGIECLIGGTRLLFSLPSYGLLSIAAILSLASFRSKRPPPDPLCIGATLLLGAWVLYRSWHSPIQYLALPDFFMMLACLMTYLLTAFYLTGMRERTVMIVVLWVIAAAEVWVAVVQFLKDPKFMLFGLMRPTTARPSGMYISPNNFAGLLVAVAILSVCLGIWSRWPGWVKFLAFYVAAFCLLGAAVSGSRGGYLDIVGGLFCVAIGAIYTVRAADPRKFLPVALGSLGGLVALLAFAAFLMSHSQYLVNRMQMMTQDKDVRIYNWEAAIDHIKVSPWIGTGAGTHLIYGRLFRRPQIQADPVHAHCDYLELLAEYGILGGLCMALFLTAHARRGLRSFSEILRRRMIPSGFHHSNSFALQLGALCAVAGLAIHEFVDFDMHVPANAMVFAFIFGILANPGMERRPTFVDRRVTPWAKLLAPALGVFMLWRGLPLFPSEYYAEMSRVALRDHKLLDVIKLGQKAIAPPPAAAPVDAPTPAPQDQPLPDFIDKLWTKTGGNPANPNPYFYIGEANRELGTRLHNPYLQKMYFTRAVSAFDAGLKVFPQDENMLLRDAQALDGLNQSDQADAIYQKALALDPNLGALRDYYLAHLRANGKNGKADSLLRQWTPSAPKVLDLDQSSEEPALKQ